MERKTSPGLTGFPEYNRRRCQLSNEQHLGFQLTTRQLEVLLEQLMG